MAFLSGWTHRVPITIDQTKIDTSLTHFALPIFLGTAVGISDADMSAIFDELGSNSKKIAVTKSDETTQIYVEIEKWDSVNEKAVLWVSKSDLVLSSSVDTVLYLYFDNTHADNTTYVGDAGSRTEVWESTAKAVYLLTESGNGTSGEFLDSTSNNNDGRGGNGTSSKVPTRDTSSDKFICQTFDGGDFIFYPDSTSWSLGNGNWTVKFRIYMANVNIRSQGFVSNRLSTSSTEGWNFSNYYGPPESGMIKLAVRTTSRTSPNAFLSASAWHDVTIVRTGTSLQWYRDGSLIFTSIGPFEVDMTNPGGGLVLGRYYADFDNSYLANGSKMSMVEIYSTGKSAEWISTRYQALEDNLVTFGTIENDTPTATIDESFSLNDSWTLQETPINTSFNENMSLNDAWGFQLNPESATIDESLTLSDSWDIQSSNPTFEFNESLSLEDNWIIQETPINTSFNESLSLSDSWDISTFQPIDYPNKIISYNPLIFVTDTDPAQIVKVDVSIPTVPVRTTYIITGCKNAKDVIINNTNDYFYVLCAEGKVAKIEIADLNNQTVINTGEVNLLQLGGSLDNFFKTYIGTDDASGEIVMIDEAEIKKINTDFRFIRLIHNKIQTQVNTILGKLLSLDFRFKQTVSKQLMTDIRWLKYSYNTINYNGIDYTKIQVKVNNVDLVPLNDVNMQSISVEHDIDNEYDGSKATFILNRLHDRLNFDNLGNSSEITNQNAVVIIINGITEFTGNIDYLNINSDNETVTVSALGQKRNSINNAVSIPLPSLDEKLHLYHCLVNSVNIQNPKVDVNNKSPKYYKGIRVDLGTSITQHIEINSYKETFFSSSLYETLASRIESGLFIPDQNWTYFWFVSAENLIDKSKTFTTMRYIGTSLSAMSNDTWKITKADYIRQKIRPDTSYLLGDGVVVEADFEDVDDNPAQIINALTTNGYIAGNGTILPAFKYVDSGDYLLIHYTNNKRNIIYDIVKNKLGYYLGEAPFKTISATNGKKSALPRREDGDDGLYMVKDEGYNYISYCEEVASIEYEKIKSINSEVLPLTSADIVISLDAYYYYNINLSSRVNITNTTTEDIYNNNNGFPLSVKNISINTSSMKVTLSCSNQKSQEELDILDDRIKDLSDDEYSSSATTFKNYNKYIPNADSNSDTTNNSFIPNILFNLPDYDFNNPT